MNYKHTQTGWVIHITCGLGVGLVWWLERSLPPHFQRQVPTFLAAVVILIVMLLFASLTVEVDNQIILLRFGPGLIWKKLTLADVVGCKVVRNRWWMGWGIHGWPGLRGGWLFNVSGLDAVELRLKDGRVIRIGPDEPQKLLDAIQDRLGGRVV